VPDQTSIPEHVIETSTGTLRVRPARAADDAALRRLFSSITMEADLSLRVDREPDFFALYELQGASACEAWTGEIDGELMGLGTLMARDGYVDGEVRRIGYLGDLRLDPRVRGREILATLYGPVLDDFAARHGVDVFYTVVIASNTRAVAALTGPKAASLGIPTYHLLQKFRIRALQTVAARRPPRALRRRWSAGTATDADIPEIAALLDRDARTRLFGVPMDAQRLRDDLAHWPGLTIEDVVVVRDARDDRIVGCLAPWDATPAKQTVVTAYRGSMRWVKRGYGIAARALRAPGLPAPGRALRYSYATHQAVEGDDPEILRVLLHAAWKQVRAAGRGDVFLSCRVPNAEADSDAYRGFVVNDLPAHVYAVVPGGAGLPAELDGAERIGFEMALV
jgi:hypothetical protein